MAANLSTYIFCLYLMGILCIQIVNSDETTEGGPTAAPPPSGSSNPVNPLPIVRPRPFTIQIDEELESKTLKQGERLTLDCSISGYPRPHYEWFKDGVQIPVDSRKYTIRPTDWGHRLRISSTNVGDSGTYMCTAENVIGKKNSTALITVLPAERTTTVASAVQPSVMKSGETDLVTPFCQDYKGTYCSVILPRQIYVTSREDQLNGETSVVDLMVQLTNINVNLDSMCFKKCVEAACYDRMPLCAERPGGLPPVPRRLCKQECAALYKICRAHFPADASSWNLLPLCEELDNNAGCVRIGLTTGSEEVTNKATSSSRPAKDSGEESVALTQVLLSIALPVILAVLLVIAIIVIAVCICKRRNKMKGGNSAPSSNASHGKSVELSSLSDRGTGPAYIKDVSLDNINMLQELGESSFGKVYHGQVFGLYGNNTASAVFIKCLQEKAGSEELAEFREEVSSMSEIRHQHIVSLLAISTKGLTQCVLYEHLQLGDLRQFILSQQSRGNSLTCKEIMYIVTQVASALEYLSSLHYVHKDIAAHNVIVSHNLNVKLSNLKIINGVHSSNYCLIHNKMLPIRWLPPESITYNKFSPDTDIYSYGVLLWEAFNGATQPYVSFTNQEVIEMVRSRQLLACPTTCPPRLYSLMMECWHEAANKRPTAKYVHQKMRAWYLDNSYAISTTTGPSVSASGSTCTAPSHHSSTGLPASNLNTNSNHTNLTDIQGSRNAVDDVVIRPGYLQTNNGGGQEDTAPYYSTIDSSYAPGPHTASSSSFDNASEYTASTNPPPLQPLINNAMPPNYYTSTPTHRYASLNRRNNESDFGTQTTPLFQQTDQV